MNGKLDLRRVAKQLSDKLVKNFGPESVVLFKVYISLDSFGMASFVSWDRYVRDRFGLVVAHNGDCCQVRVRDSLIYELPDDAAGTVAAAVKLTIRDKNPGRELTLSPFNHFCSKVPFSEVWGKFDSELFEEKFLKSDKLETVAFAQTEIAHAIANYEAAGRDEMLRFEAFYRLLVQFRYKHLDVLFEKDPPPTLPKTITWNEFLGRMGRLKEDKEAVLLDQPDWQIKAIETMATGVVRVLDGATYFDRQGLLSIYDCLSTCKVNISCVLGFEAKAEEQGGVVHVMPEPVTVVESEGSLNDAVEFVERNFGRPQKASPNPSILIGGSVEGCRVFKDASNGAKRGLTAFIPFEKALREQILEFAKVLQDRFGYSSGMTEWHWWMLAAARLVQMSPQFKRNDVGGVCMK